MVVKSVPLLNWPHNLFRGCSRPAACHDHQIGGKDSTCDICVSARLQSSAQLYAIPLWVIPAAVPTPSAG
jgi:hypothetical protein